MSSFAPIATVFAPLLGFLLAGLLGRYFKPLLSHIVTCSLMFLSMGCGWYLFVKVGLGDQNLFVPLFSFIDVGALRGNWAITVNPLISVMVVVVTTVSFLVHVYSIGYMSHDDSQQRFTAYLSLFTFMMLALVTADNLIQLFFGWEGVGLSSYLLIGFWYTKPAANAAAIKAFVMNRIGDLGLVLGMGALFYLFNTLEIDSILTLAPKRTMMTFSAFGFDVNALEIACILLFVGAMGKSAQLGLHTWLPDAMEGPTPVSALIHAATMVTAGVFLIARLSPLYELAPLAREIITVVGATTAVFAGTIALTQFDIKRVIAYSTCSQLGYMFLSAGLSAYGASIFHLATHAFFKALLFLGAGSVIHSLSDEQDMRNMGGVWKMIFVTYSLMVVGSIALMGIPPFAGFYSKDLILEAAFETHTTLGEYAYIMGLLAAVLTAFYSGRLLFLTFHGKPRADEKVMGHLHESGLIMLVPLLILSIGAIFSGIIGESYATSGEFWGGSIAFSEPIEAQIPLIVKGLPMIAAFMGFGVAFYAYVVQPSLPGKISRTLKGVYQFLYNKWYFDELYTLFFVRFSLWIGNWFWRIGDGAIIDGFGPDGVTAKILRLSSRSSLLQTGLLNHYATAMILSLACVMGWLLFRN